MLQTGPSIIASYLYQKSECTLKKKHVRSTPIRQECGGVAHLVERQLCKLDVAGSSPVTSTTQILSAP